MHNRGRLSFFGCLLLLILSHGVHPLKSQNRQRLTVKIDPRFETISLFYILAISDSLDKEDRPAPSVYYRDVKQYFSGCKNHPSLQWYRKLENMDGFDIPSLGIFLSPPPTMKVERKVEIPYLRSTPDMELFLKKINIFSADCKTDRFIRLHQSYYRQIESGFKTAVETSRILSDVQRFFRNDKVNETAIFLDMLNNAGNNAIPLKQGADAKTFIIRLGYIADPERQLTDKSPVNFVPPLNVIAHECSHVYINDFTTRYKDRLFHIRGLFEEDDWENDVEELIVRACVAKILEARNGKPAGLEEVKIQAGHYKYIEGLYRLLDRYVSETGRYHSIQDFYPEIIEYLERLAPPGHPERAAGL